MLRKSAIAAATGIVILLGAGAAKAELITYYFGGSIGSISDPTGALAGAVEVGDSFSGSYSLDLATPDAYPQNPVLGRYISVDAHMDLDVGSISIHATGNGLRASVWDDDWNWDGFDFTSDPLTTGQLVVNEFSVAITDSTSNAFASDALPVLVDIAAFDGRSFSFNGYELDGGQFFVGGSVAYFFTPEPEMFITVSLAVAPLLSRRRVR